MHQTITATTAAALENTVTALLADKLENSSAPEVTSKYMTSNNHLIYLTLSNATGADVAKLRIRVIERVQEGVQEVSYVLYGDHRLESTQNAMVFGNGDSATQSNAPAAVDEANAQALVKLISTLTNS